MLLAHDVGVGSGLTLVGGPDGNDPIAADTHGTGQLIRAAVEAGMAQGQIDHLDPEALAQLLLAACCGAAQLVATDPDPATARARVGATLDRLVAGLAPG